MRTSINIIIASCLHSRGVNDAVNAHPIEYMTTAIFIPNSVAVCPVSCHITIILLYVSLNAALSAINHSRLDVECWPIYSSRYHDTHHTRGQAGGNYAQFSWYIDWLFGTCVPWKGKNSAFGDHR